MSHAVQGHQDRQVIVKRSDKLWSIGGVNSNPLQYSCHKNPMNSMKKQKDMTLENEPPQVLKVSNMLLGKSGGQFLIAPERMKHLCQSGNDIQSWMCMKWSASISDSMDVNLSKLWETVEDRGPWCAAVQGLQRVGHDLVADQQYSHWSIKELVFYLFYGFYFISFYFILFSLSYLKMSPVIEIYPGLSHTTAIQMSTPRGIFQCLLLL